AGNVLGGSLHAGHRLGDERRFVPHRNEDGDPPTGPVHPPSIHAHEPTTTPCPCTPCAQAARGRGRARRGFARVSLVLATDMRPRRYSSAEASPERVIHHGGNDTGRYRRDTMNAFGGRRRQAIRRVRPPGLARPTVVPSRALRSRLIATRICYARKKNTPWIMPKRRSSYGGWIVQRAAFARPAARREWQQGT